MAKKYIGITDLTNAYALKKGITKKYAEEILKDVIDLARELLLEDNDGIQIIDFITLKKVKRKSKLGRNPKDPEETIVIPERIGIKVDLGKQFNKELND